MRKAVRPVSWVVYRMKVHGKEQVVNAVCEQSEWEAMQKSQPGQHTLVREKIASEAEAERLARGDSGNARIRLSSRS